MWGLDSLADCHPAVRIAGLVLFGIAILPPVGGRIVRGLAWIGRSVPDRLSFAGGSAGALLLLWAMRSRNMMLGDAQTYVSTIEKGMRAAGGAHREPLAQAIVTGFHSLFGSAIGIGGQGSFAAVEILLAVAAAWIGVLLARRIAIDTGGRILVFAAILLGGGLQLFSGYPEFYGFSLVAILLFALLGVRWCDEGGSLIPSALAFVLAGLMHAQAIFAAPAVVYLVIRGWRDGRRRDAFMAATVVPAAAAAGLVLLRYPFGEIGREASRAASFLPPLGAMTGRTAYGAFSPAHAIELLNVAILITPALFPLIALALLRHGTGDRAPGSRLDPPSPESRARRGIFLGLLAIGPILFALFANPQLGMVRDWDIFALPLTVVSLWGASRAVRARTMGGHGTSAVAGMVFATSLLHSFFWLQANHSPELSRERIERVAANASLFGPQSLGETWRYIGSSDAAAGRLERASRSYRAAIAADPDDRMGYRMLAGIEITRAVGQGKGVDEGIAAYHTLLEARTPEAGGRPRPAYAHYGGAIAAVVSGREDIALREAKEMIAEEPTHPELLAFWGDLMRRGARVGEARKAYDAALSLDPSQPRARIGLACLAAAAGDEATCEALAREALRRTPWSPQAQQFARMIRQGSGGISPDSFRRYLFVQ